MDTIFARASAPGKSGVVVIRVSGPLASQAVSGFCSLPSDRGFSLSLFRDVDGSIVDEVLVLYFPSGQSFTGEEVVEIQAHGSPAVCDKILSLLGSADGCRLAEPGEFSKRALENGNLSLTELEALGDLIESETETQRQQAMWGFTGGLDDVVSSWRSSLISCSALLESSIDFADEDVPDEVSDAFFDQVVGLRAALNDMLARSKRALKIRDGFVVSISGPPNVGKSTLFNYISGQPLAIVSDLAGTTRDSLEVSVDLDGYPVRLVDTAGIRDVGDALENLAIGRSREVIERSDLRIFLVLSDGDLELFDVQADDIVCFGKSDIGQSDRFSVSGLTGEGVQELLGLISDRLMTKSPVELAVARQRQVDCLSDALSNLDLVLSRRSYGVEYPEILAGSLSLAIADLDRFLGRIDVEEVLGEIYSKFCIGK